MNIEEMSNSGSDAGPDPITGEDVVAETNYPLNEEVEVPMTRGQLFKTVSQEGTGSTPPDGAEVTVHYTGTLADGGAKFDSSRDRGDYFKFTIGKGSVIKGWDKGVATMKKGERANLKCAPEYAYGAGGSPPTIPANATLNFDVELFDWTKSEDISANKDKSVTKSTTIEGQGYEKPDYETACVVDVAVMDRDCEVDGDKAQVLATKADWDVVIGDTELPTGLETMLKSMKKGEVSYVAIKKVTVSCPELSEALKADGSTQHLRVAMKDFVKVKTYEIQGQARVDEGAKRKDQGNGYFKTQNWAKAIQKYTRGLEFVESEYDLSDEEKAAAAKIKIATWGNLSQCLINNNQTKEALTYCDKVLTEDPKNEKALFRRGKARGAMQEWDDGIKDLQRILELNPSNGDAAAELSRLQEVRKQHNAKEKAKYSKMFS